MRLDFAEEDSKADFSESLPNVGEYNKETKLSFEKEVLGIYVSGHPLDEYKALWEKNITATALDFYLDPETNYVKIEDQKRVTIGGIITEKTIKYTKNNKAMAFITVEDLLGVVEVIIFPKDYEKYSKYLIEDSKVFVKGKASVEEDKNGKIILEELIPFSEIPKKLWIAFPDKATYMQRFEELKSILSESDGRDRVWIYLTTERAMKDLGPAMGVNADAMLVNMLKEKFGSENITLS